MSQEATYSVTFVQGKPPMITVRADDADTWKANLDSAASSGALTLIKGINDSLNGVRPAAQPASPAVPRPAPAAPGPSENWKSTRDQAAQELPDGFASPACAECQGPTRFAQEGVSKRSGQPYKRFQCTANQLHKSTFA